jgi:EmrB/QacA subfamily drug resistance transporter
VGTVDDHVTVAGRTGLVLIAMTSTMALLVLDSSIVGVMLPSIGKDLSLSTTAQAWVVSSYLLSLAVLLPLGGRLADAFGPRTMFVCGMVGFVVASVGIAAAAGSAALILWRTAAGCAGALLMPSTMSILLGSVAPDGRARAMAVYTGFGQAFAVFGPFVGGVCAQYLGWQWGFLINVPIGVGGVLLLLISRPANPRTPVTSWDPVGLLTLTIGLLGVVFALLQAPAWGWTAPVTVVTMAIGAAASCWFVVSSLSRAHPLLNLRLFSVPSFASGSVMLFSVGFATTVASVYGAMVIQQSLQLPPAAGGVALLPLVLPLLVATRWVAGRYARLGARTIGLVGAPALAVGLLATGVGFWLASLWLVCVGLVPAGVGIGLLMSPMTTASMSDIADHERGQASGIVTTIRQMGGILGVAAFSATAAVFHASSDDISNTAAGVGFGIAAVVVALAAASSRLPVRSRCPCGRTSRTTSASTGAAATRSGAGSCSPTPPTS